MYQGFTDSFEHCAACGMKKKDYKEPAAPTTPTMFQNLFPKSATMGGLGGIVQNPPTPPPQQGPWGQIPWGMVQPQQQQPQNQQGFAGQPQSSTRMIGLKELLDNIDTDVSPAAQLDMFQNILNWDEDEDYGDDDY